MKSLQIFLLLSVFLIGGVSAQTTGVSNSTEVSVIQQKWHPETRNSALLDEDPFRAINDTAQNERNRLDNKRQNEIRSKLGLPLEGPPALVSSAQTASNASSTNYIYETKVKNNSLKQIKSINWEYVFVDSQTKQEVGRLKFVNEIKIRSGDTKNILMRSASPPTGAIDARHAGKKLSELYNERVIIQKIEYVDGTIWTADSN